jgi:two-component system, NtrC family, response regulator AtoC
VNSVLLVLSVFRSAETRVSVTKVVARAGHKLVQTSGCQQAKTLLNNGVEPDLVILEASCSGTPYDLREIVRAASPAPVCLVCGPGDQRLRKSAADLGITSFLERPVIEEDLLKLFNRQCCSSLELNSRVHPESADALEIALPPGKAIVEELGDGRYFLAACPSMTKIHHQIHLLADVDAPVLILGESGTGKEVIAHLIHKHSRRSSHSFVNVNCAALPTDLLESELFGYHQGAFTGAIKDKPGKFELANRGTLLLDEIGEMSGQMQAKLLHVLQDGQFNRLGARESSRVDVRVLAATNVPIEEALVGKTFREDLYYRLNVFTITVPPLRERTEEIPYLVEEIVRRSPEELRGGTAMSFSARLMEVVQLYSWRGNVRELRNFIIRTLTMRDEGAAIQELERKIAAGQGTELEDHEFETLRGTDASGMRSVVREMKDRAEARMIQSALEVNGWNRRYAARSLNISYRGLLYKIQQHRLSPGTSLARPQTAKHKVWN